MTQWFFPVITFHFWDFPATFVIGYVMKFTVDHLKDPERNPWFLLETTYTWDQRRRGCLILMIFIEGSRWTSNFRQYGEMKKQSAGRRVRREKIRRKKMQVREKVGKSRNTVFFRGFVAPEGWKVGSLKRRVRRHLGRWEMKSCTPLWREADFEVKRYKTPQRRTTSGSWDVEKVHGVVARSTFGSKMC